MAADSWESVAAAEEARLSELPEKPVTVVTNACRVFWYTEFDATYGLLVTR